MITDFLKTPIQTKPSEYNFDKFLIEGKDFIIIKETNFERVRNQIKSNPNKIIIFQASTDEELNRKVLEKIKINIFLSPETTEKKDKLKQRNSGLNQVLCKIAKQNNVTIGINLRELIGNAEADSFISSNLRVGGESCRPLGGWVGARGHNGEKISDSRYASVEKPKLLSRIKQNIKLCRKSKTRIVAMSLAKKESELRDAQDIKSLFVTLGMSTHQIKELFWE